MTKEQHISEKKAKIKEIERDQVKLVRHAAKLLTKPFKRPETFMKRMNEAVILVTRARLMDVQKHMIVMQPYLKQPSAGQSAIVGEMGPEKINTGEHLVYFQGSPDVVIPPFLKKKL